VVGKIVEVYAHTAQVLLINDQNSGLGAIVERLRLQGIVRGSPNGETMLEKVMSDEEVQTGDKVITTGGDGIFPKGLPVGSIVKVSSSDLFLKIRLHPAADLSRLEEVLVITKMQDVAPTAGDVAGSQRAVDILAARLPGVPEKPASDKPNPEASGTEPPDGPAPAANKPAPLSAPPNAAAKKQGNESSPIPYAPGPQAKPTKSLKPALVLKPVSAQPNHDRMQ